MKKLNIAHPTTPAIMLIIPVIGASVCFFEKAYPKYIGTSNPEAAYEYDITIRLSTCWKLTAMKNAKAAITTVLILANFFSCASFAF